MDPLPESAPMASVNPPQCGSDLSRLTRGIFALAIFVAGCSFACFGAEPGPTPTKRQVADVVLVFDTSGSTLIEDQMVEGKRASRLAMEKQIALTYIQTHPSDRIGLIGFGSVPFEVSPPSTDHEKLLKIIELLRPGLVEDGSGIGDAIVSGIQALRTQGPGRRQIVLLTDGNNNAGEFSPATAAGIARDRGISLVIVGVGTGNEAPGPVMNKNGEPVHDLMGHQVYQNMKFPVDHDELKRVAESANGHFFLSAQKDLLAALDDAENEVIPRELSNSDQDRFIDHYTAPSGGRVQLSVRAEPKESLFILSAKADYKVAFIQPSPANFRDLPPGDYVLKAILAGYKTEERTVTIPVIPAGDTVDLGLISLSLLPEPTPNPQPTATPWTPAPASGSPKTSPSTSTTISGMRNVGQELKLAIRINGSRDAKPPELSPVDGLEITYVGSEVQVNMRNSEIEMSQTFNYSVVPRRAGKFVIPALEVLVGEKKLKTAPLSLKIDDSTTAEPSTPGAQEKPGQSGQPNQPSQPSQPFAELIVSKATAFLGEVIPIELRIYCDSRSQWQLNQTPNILGEGFRISKLSKETRSRVTRGGHSYEGVIFKAKVIPVKTGVESLKLTDLKCRLFLRPQRRFGPQEDFDQLFSDPFKTFSTSQEVTIKSDPANTARIEVKSLPTQDQPKNFSGAVGQFSLESQPPEPKENKSAPLLMGLKITGRGDFDAVAAPTMVANPAWSSDLPSATFHADDELGISGSKTFEIPITPKSQGLPLPLFEFTYFDPIKRTYVELRSSNAQISQ